MKILGVDIGGSGIKGAIVDTKTGKLVTERHRIPTPQPATPKAVAETLKELTKHFKWHGAVGCGFPAIVQHGVAKSAANIDKTWVDTDAAGLFSHTTGCPCYVVNDADAAGIAEVHFGAARDHNGVVLLITIGTGLGSALFSGGHLVPNTEFGHLILHDMVAEKYCSDAARKREELSRKKWAKRFNEYLQRVEFLLSPDLILLGGGASKKYDQYAEYLRVEAELQPAQQLNNAGIVGAALYAKTASKF